MVATGCTEHGAEYDTKPDPRSCDAPDKVSPKPEVRWRKARARLVDSRRAWQKNVQYWTEPTNMHMHGMASRAMPVLLGLLNIGCQNRHVDAVRIAVD